MFYIMKKRPSSKTDYCHIIADKIHKTNISCEGIEIALNEIADKYYVQGYRDAITDTKKMRDAKDLKRAKDWNRLRDIIEDTIHNK